MCLSTSSEEPAEDSVYFPFDSRFETTNVGATASIAKIGQLLREMLRPALSVAVTINAVSGFEFIADCTLAFVITALHAFTPTAFDEESATQLAPS